MLALIQCVQIYITNSMWTNLYMHSACVCKTAVNKQLLSQVWYNLEEKLIIIIIFMVLYSIIQPCNSIFCCVCGCWCVVMIVRYFDLQLPMQSVSIINKDVISIPAHGEMYSIQQYVIKFVSDLPQDGCFLHDFCKPILIMKYR
jgi:hypothetical protein